MEKIANGKVSIDTATINSAADHHHHQRHLHTFDLFDLPLGACGIILLLLGRSLSGVGLGLVVVLDLFLLTLGELLGLGQDLFILLLRRHGGCLFELLVTTKVCKQCKMTLGKICVKTKRTVGGTKTHRVDGGEQSSRVRVHVHRLRARELVI